MQLAIFGGSFDPPHIGHKAIVKKILKKLEIDLLVVVPAYLNPLKTKSFLGATTRYKLLKKLFLNKKVKISKFEIKQNRAVYSLETILHLKKKYNAKNIYLIIGADNFLNFDLWQNHEEIKKLVELVVVTREGFILEKSENAKRIELDMKISSTELRNSFNLKYIPKEIRKKIKKIWKEKFE